MSLRGSISSNNASRPTYSTDSTATTRPLTLLQNHFAPPMDRSIDQSASAGCKYARGEWSQNCLDGLRVRMDTLVGQVGNLNSSEVKLNCQQHRRVTKDCRRACHYIKSGKSGAARDGIPGKGEIVWPKFEILLISASPEGGERD